MFRSPKPAVDVLILHKSRIALIRRGRKPFKGMWALPGGFIDYGEEPFMAAIREAKEETNLDVFLKDKKHVFVYGSPERDPRRHIISIVFLAAPTNPEKIKGGDDAAEAGFFSRGEIPESLAADHRQMIKEVLGW